MVRLIDADYLLENHVVPFDVLTHGEDDDPESIELNLVPVGYIKGAPTIDAVPVVRCWECVHYDHGFCWRFDIEDNYPNDYCSYGVRKDTKAE